MSNEGISHSEYREAMPSVCQSPDPPATHATDESAEHADRAESAGATADGSASADAETAGVTADSSASVGGEPLLIDAAELARLLMVSVKTIDRWLRAKKLPAPIVIGRERRWRRQEIEQWLAAGAPSQHEWVRHQRDNNPKQ
jgi:excisionase family DNA binding protein